jgi:uncharacterized protein (TIGR02594 family)
MTVTAFDLAQRFTGTKEVAGVADNPLIVAMLRLDQTWPGHDEVAWCSAFCNFIAWLLRLPRSKSLAARSWLAVGQPVDLEEATVGFDVVVFKRGTGEQPGPDVLDAPGHVAFFAGLNPDKTRVLVLGGNQSNSVSVSSFPAADVLGVRRLA